MDAQKHLIKAPGITWLRSPPTQPSGEVGAEPVAPPADALMRDHDAALGQDQLNIARTEAEDVVESEGVADDLTREVVATVGAGSGRHPISLTQPAPLGQRPPTCQCR